MMSWSFQPILNSYAVVAVLALGLLLAVRLVRPSRRLGAARERILRVIRLMVVALVIIGMLRPTHISTQERSQTAVLVVLFDQTRSMQLPNAAGEQSRWEAQIATLRQLEPLLGQMGDGLDVAVHGYDSQLRDPAWANSRLSLPSSPDGTQTDIGTSLHQAAQQQLGKRLVGVILMGDGTQTAIQPEVEIFDAARELGNRGYPLYAVTFGPAGDAAQSRDVAIENLPEQYSAFVKNELVVRGLVRIRGYVNQEIPVWLTVEDAQGGRQELGPVRVRADQDNQQLDVNIPYVPQEPGQYRLTLRAEPQPGELVTKNNQLTAFLTVYEGGLRVLFLEGEPRQEQKFIRWAIDSSPDMELDFQWFPSRLRDQWPVFLGDTFERGNYDVFILGDCDSTALGEANLQQLADEVGRGKGLIALGGYHSFGPGGYRNTPLRDVLPVEMDRLARQEFGRPEVQQWHVPGPLPMLPTRPHPVTLLAAESDNEPTWRALRPLQGANRWAGIKQTPGIQVLAESPDQVPLLVAGEYGAGRVLAFAGDSTWQWWRQGLNTTHRRFWRQVILWLARRDDMTGSDVWIDLAQRRLQVGSRVDFTTGARTALGDPLPDAQVAAVLHDPAGRTSPLSLTRQGDAFSGSSARLTAPGNYRIEVTAVDSGGERLGDASASFEIMDQDLELNNPAADPDQMARLANLTREVGGRSVAPEELPGLLREIQQNPPPMVEEVLMKWQLADTWWDAWIALGSLLALLACEWYLRKRWGLV
jgi:hypothetical protein